MFGIINNLNYMLKKIIYFLKYNNATVIILAVILILGGGALAAGPDAIGSQTTSVQNIDNTLLLAANLDNFAMDFKIESISQDDAYYYVTYSYLDLDVIDSAWQYELREKQQKISKKQKEDLGVYLEKFLAKQQEARVRELTKEKKLAQSAGPETRVEVTEYTGLIGQTLDLAAKVFPGYEPVKKRQLPSPEFTQAETSNPSASLGHADNLTQIYNNYIASHPDLFSAISTPMKAAVPDASSTPAQTAPLDSSASSTPSATETPAIPQPATVEIINLPAPAPATETAPAPSVEPAPAPAQATGTPPAGN